MITSPTTHCWESIPHQPYMSTTYSCDYKSNGTLLGIDPTPAIHEYHIQLWLQVQWNTAGNRSHTSHTWVPHTAVITSPMEHCWESIPDQPDISVTYSCDYKSNHTLLGIDPTPAIHDERKGNALFNNTLNTFYLQLYGSRHMVKNHSDRDRGNLLLPLRLLFLINSKGSFICIIPQRG